MRTEAAQRPAAGEPAPQAFARDVLHGLGRRPRTLPCKWLYDEAGSRLFEQITATREYYPTRVEKRLLGEMAGQIAGHVPDLRLIVEPGSGACVKTRTLLESQPRLETYIPIDICAEFLQRIARELRQEYPHLCIRPQVGDFAAPLAPLAAEAGHARLLFFPGSTIGNFEPARARRLLTNFRRLLGAPGWLLLGADATREEARLLAAYNDAAGITAQFNKNLLARANRELGADFELAQFTHQAVFDRRRGRVEMHLVSRCRQQVRIAGRVFQFAAAERIHTENCYKYAPETLVVLAQAAGWRCVQCWLDEHESRFGLFLFHSG